ncbi:MAG: DUF1501 domain-containing protein, partial [Planctomycetes bacterium]|nr:DUF1501 domain-containing protein [Planctomycetota bacterium]
PFRIPVKLSDATVHRFRPIFIPDHPEDDRVSVNDLHATILHLMGLDHKKLTYNFNGRKYRLTDVAGNVILPIIA